MEISEILGLSPVIPVVTIQDSRHAVALVRALVTGGISVVEINFSAPGALQAIKAISEALPNVLVGAGSLTDPAQFDMVKQAGAKFAVSPGLTPPLMAAAKASGLPFIPGAVTPCEIMAAQQMGFKTLKFFPAEVTGGVKTLKMLTAIFPDIQFYPMGGITRVNMKDYLSLANVIAVAGNWLTPSNFMEEKNWDAIATLAREVRS